MRAIAASKAESATPLNIDRERRFRLLASRLKPRCPRTECPSFVPKWWKKWRAREDSNLDLPSGGDRACDVDAAASTLVVCRRPTNSRYALGKEILTEKSSRALEVRDFFLTYIHCVY
jgi:hypothetical protein